MPVINAYLGRHGQLARLRPVFSKANGSREPGLRARGAFPQVPYEMLKLAPVRDEVANNIGDHLTGG
jgi:hypothetical protein